MLKKLESSAIVLSVLLLSGCGGGSSINNSKSAESILKGKTFYYQEVCHDGSERYHDLYKNIFALETLTETHYDNSSNPLEEDILPINYSKNKFTITKFGVTGTCTVSESNNHPSLKCEFNDFTQELWNTQDEAKQNPTDSGEC